MDNYLVSVIIPAYNVEQYFAEAIDSVISQTYKNMEIIVVDDGSTDRTGELCDEYAGKDNRVNVVHKQNGGVSSARNVGLDMIHGDIVAFLDSDDSYHPDYVRIMVDKMREDGSDIVICKYSLFSGHRKMVASDLLTGYPVIEEGTYDQIEAFRRFVRVKNMNGMWNKIYRSELWDEIRFGEGHIYEDESTIFKLFDICKSISIIDQVLYFHRNHPHGISKRRTWQSINDRIIASSSYDEYVKSHIPEIFTEADYLYRKQNNINAMILHYSSYTPDEGDPSRENFRQLIIKAANEIGIERLSTKTRLSIGVLHICPVILRIVYPSYIHLRFLTQKYLGGRSGS